MTEPTALDRAAWFSLRALVVGLAAVCGMWVAAQLRLVLVPVAGSLLLGAVLRPVAARLRRVLPPSAAAIVAVLSLVLLVAGALALAGQQVASDADELSDAVSEGIEDLEEWLVEGPIGLERSRLEELRGQLGDWASEAASGGVASGAFAAGEVLAGTLLALVLTVFVVRDGDRVVDAVARRSPPGRAVKVRLGADAVWWGLRRYLLGSATLGFVEAIAIGGTVAIVGSPLAAPVAVFTFLAAFVPLVGAIVAGVVAVLAAFVTGGLGAALAVAVVAIVVQQLDNDLLGPFIYGRATQLHPAVVLVSITAGTTIAGLAGAFLAVPIVTVAVAVHRALTDEAAAAEIEAAEAEGGPGPPEEA